MKGLPPLNCVGCTACCESETGVPIRSDEAHKFQVEMRDDGLHLQTGDNGHCIYLVKSFGCKVHADKPMICRDMDCRKYLTLTPTQLQTRMDVIPNFAAILKAAKRQKATQ